MGFCKDIFKRKKDEKPGAAACGEEVQVYNGEIPMYDERHRNIILVPATYNPEIELHICDTIIVYNKDTRLITNKSKINLDILMRKLLLTQKDFENKQVLAYEDAALKAVILDDVVKPILDALVQ